jgi:hypothetical protein
MDMTTVFTNIENSQAAKKSGADKLAADQAKAAAIAAAVTQDTADATTLAAAADADVQAGITFLQSLLSTPAAAPVT